jgi:hypothetical protein
MDYVNLGVMGANLSCHLKIINEFLNRFKYLNYSLSRIMPADHPSQAF